MLLTKYSHAQRNPCHSPKARFAQMYSPPSSGKFADKLETTSADGRKNASAAMSQRTSDPGPACAAAASHRTPITEEILTERRKGDAVRAVRRVGWHSQSQRTPQNITNLRSTSKENAECSKAPGALFASSFYLFRTADLLQISGRQIRSIVRAGRSGHSFRNQPDLHPPVLGG